MSDNAGQITDQSIDWITVSELVAQGLAERIPVVGAAVSYILSTFWPSGNDNSIWDSIAQRVQALVDQAILGAELEAHSEALAGLQVTMHRYTVDMPPEQGATLVDALGKADDLAQALMTDSNHIHFLPLTVALSQLHMTILAEQQQHGTTIFAEPGQPPGPHNPSWDAQTTEQRIAYETYFPQAFSDWWTWRAAQIEEHNGRTWAPWVWSAHGSATDNLIGQEIYYSDNANSNSDYYRDVAYAAYFRFVNQARAEMARAISPTFLLNLYDPITANNRPNVNPSIAYLTLGPLCPASLGLNGTGNVQIAASDVPGTITGVTIQAGNAIDGFQLHYTDHDGVFSGGGSSGGPGNVAIPSGGYPTGVQATFNNLVMYEVAVDFSDGSSTPSYGNAGGWTGVTANGTVSAPYQLYAAEYSTGGGPSGATETDLLQLHFVHSSLLANPQRKSVLVTGEYLPTWDYLGSEWGDYYCVMQSDANLCTYAGLGSPNTGPEVWNSNSPSPGGEYYLIMQGDGNLCIYAGHGPPNAGGDIWQSGVTGPLGDYFAILDKDACLKVVAGTPAVPGAVLWSTPPVASSQG